MLTPTAINIVYFFYPIGNTPAVCLTQDLPCEQRADILLLGCGDVRNILFTTYSDSEFKPRRLDITCCDIEAAVLARNILLFTLLIDDTAGRDDTVIWNIYYHLFLDPKSLEVLQNQSKKLHTYASSIQSWHDSKYGRFLRFCDQGTFARVRDIWSSYSTAESTEDEKADYNKRFKLGIQKAVNAKEAFLGSGLTITGVRSAAPVGLQSMQDLPELYRHFWDYGITDKDPDILSQAKLPNPMFASQVTDTFTLHYGTDPLLGFHLAIAYAPLTAGSPLRPKLPGKSDLHKVVEAARIQFRAWAISFRRRAYSGLILRFFAGDALAFCHTLQNKRITKRDTSAHWYRDSYHFEPLVLDGEDYAVLGKGPLSFNVIDTSNLADHIGALNVLIAASPLLTNNVFASLYTESLVKRENSQKALIDKFLCGHFPTISILLGLFPVEYWTEATAISTAGEVIMEAFSIFTRDLQSSPGQMHCRLAWKPSISTSKRMPQTMANQGLRFNERDLAHILYEVYQGMFGNEDMTQLFSKLDVLAIQNNSRQRYHRGSFASLLRLVKDRVEVDWNQMMDILLDLITNNRTLMMGSNYFQELIVYLHLFDVYSMPILSRSTDHTKRGRVLEGLSTWVDIPAVVCITLRVPRARLGVFTSLPPTKLGSPTVHCILQPPSTYAGGSSQNIFAAVQLAFGKITTSGPRNSADFRIHVAEDRTGWTGSSPLIVSFYAPTWLVLLEPQNANITFGIQSTPLSAITFVKTLGFEMNVYSTTLGDENNVYISRHPPNQSAYPALCGNVGSDAKIIGPLDTASRTTITANVDRDTSRIVAFIGRVDVLSGEAKSSLTSQAVVKATQITPCIIGIIIGPNGPQHCLHFPAPVLHSRSKTRIARKSFYIEVEAPIAGLANGERFPYFMYPILITGHGPIIWNMPHLNLECLPILDMKRSGDLQWLITHTSLQFSARERTLREKASAASTEIHKDVRLNFKDSLFSMFMHFSGLQGGQSRVFGINHPTGGGVHILFFVSCLRLEIANHTVVLDAAVLPLTDRLMPQISPFLEALTGMGFCTINVDDDELRLWREVLPAMVERCRQWEHRPSCEYKAEAQIPLSINNGQPLLCSCGNGTLPLRFISGIPKWDVVSKHTVRVAISPSFSVPFVEQIFEASGARMAADIFDNRCQNCGKEKSSEGANLLRCSRCSIAKYCSSRCQRADWKVHKKLCSK